MPVSDTSDDENILTPLTLLRNQSAADLNVCIPFEGQPLAQPNIKPPKKHSFLRANWDSLAIASLFGLSFCMYIKLIQLEEELQNLRRLREFPEVYAVGHVIRYELAPVNSSWSFFGHVKHLISTVLNSVLEFVVSRINFDF